MRTPEEIRRSIRAKTRPKSIFIKPEKDTPYCDSCKKEGVEFEDDEGYYCPVCNEVLNEYKLIDPANKRILIAHPGDGKGANDDYPLGEGAYWLEDGEHFGDRSSTYYPASDRYE